jgi:hypothetical protein
MRPLWKIVFTTLIFCVGIGIIVSSFSFAEPFGGLYSGYLIAPLPCAVGWAICIISGVVLLKAIREYLNSP